MSSNLLSLNHSKSVFFIFGILQQLSKLIISTNHLPNKVILSPVESARNLGVIFDTNLSFAQHKYAFSKSCFHSICDLMLIRNTIDQTACTIATSLIHPKIDDCNCLLLNLPATQTKRLQLFLNSAAHTVTKTPKCYHITPILKSLHCLKINEIIKYKALSKLVNLLTSALFFHSLHTVLFGLCLLSLLVALLSPLISKLHTDLSYHFAPVFWNSLPSDLHHVAHYVTLATITYLNGRHRCKNKRVILYRNTVFIMFYDTC